MLIRAPGEHPSPYFAFDKIQVPVLANPAEEDHISENSFGTLLCPQEARVTRPTRDAMRGRVVARNGRSVVDPEVRSKRDDLGVGEIGWAVGGMILRTVLGAVGSPPICAGALAKTDLSVCSKRYPGFVTRHEDGERIPGNTYSSYSVLLDVPPGLVHSVDDLGAS